MLSQPDSHTCIPSSQPLQHNSCPRIQHRALLLPCFSSGPDCKQHVKRVTLNGNDTLYSFVTYSSDTAELKVTNLGLDAAAALSTTLCITLEAPCTDLGTFSNTGIAGSYLYSFSESSNNK